MGLKSVEERKRGQKLCGEGLDGRGYLAVGFVRHLERNAKGATMERSLVSTRNNTTTEHKVMTAARLYFRRRRGLSCFYEHGQWWVENRPSGSIYSVVDASPGLGSTGLDLEAL